MKVETFIIHTVDDITPCAAWIKELYLIHGALEIVVSNKTRSRSSNQHRLLWKWNTEIANHLGIFKDEVHEMLKRKFAVSIFTRDDPDYGDMVAAVKAIRKQGMADYAEALAKEISRLTSTTTFNVVQMSEYLEDIKYYSAEIGAELSFPEDLINSL